MVMSEEAAITAFVQKHGGLGHGAASQGSVVATRSFDEPDAWTYLYRLTPRLENGRIVKRNEKVKVRSLYAWRQLVSSDDEGKPVFSREPWPEEDNGPIAPVGDATVVADHSGTKGRRRKRRRRRKRG